MFSATNEVRRKLSFMGGREDIMFISSNPARKFTNICPSCLHDSLPLLPDGPRLVLHECSPILQESLRLWALHEALSVLATVSSK